MKKYILDILGLDKESRKELFTIETLKVAVVIVIMILVIGFFEGI